MNTSMNNAQAGMGLDPLVAAMGNAWQETMPNNLFEYIRVTFPEAVVTRDVPGMHQGNILRWKKSFDLIGDGVAGDNRLEGKEELIDFQYDQMRFDQHRLGIRSRGKMAELFKFDIGTASLVAQKFAIRYGEIQTDMFLSIAAGISPKWSTLGCTRTEFARRTRGDRMHEIGGVPHELTSESELSQLDFMQDCRPPTSNRVAVMTADGYEFGKGSDKLTKDGIITLDKLNDLRTELMQFNFGPLFENPGSGAPIAPEAQYLMVVPPNIYNGLKKELREYWKHAMPRSEMNPLFRGLEMLRWDGWHIMTHRYAPSRMYAKDGLKYGEDGDIDGGQVLIFGKNAINAALPTAGLGAENFPYCGQIVPKFDIDYGNTHSWAYINMFGFARASGYTKAPNDNGTRQDLGVISLYAADPPKKGSTKSEEPKAA